MLSAHELPGLVGGDAHQPRTQPVGLAQSSQLAPGDRPRGLGGVLREVRVAADHSTDAGHVVVVGAHDPGERRRVARDRLLDGRRGDGSRGREFADHAPQMRGEVRSVPDRVLSRSSDRSPPRRRIPQPSRGVEELARAGERVRGLVVGEHDDDGIAFGEDRQQRGVPGVTIGDIREEVVEPCRVSRPRRPARAARSPPARRSTPVTPAAAAAMSARARRGSSRTRLRLGSSRSGSPA